MPIEVIIAGLPRTGNTTIKTALELLGYNETMHMLSCMQNSELRQAWKDIYVNHSERTWTDADWRDLFDKRFPQFVAGTDAPFSDFALEIARVFPDAKVILTYRDPDAWLKSFQNLMKGFSYWQFFCLLPIPNFYSQKQFLDTLQEWWQDVYNYPQVGNQVMQIYTDKIKAEIEPERLLVYKVQDSWGPLCKFLNKEIPQEDFPHLNETAAAEENIKEYTKIGLNIWLKWLKKTSIFTIALVAIVLVYKKSFLFH